jgi:TonB family protein
MTAAALVAILLPFVPLPVPAFQAPPAPETLRLPLVRYPDEARRTGAAGEMEYVARLDRYGRVTDIAVRKVPRPGVGFEEALRQALMGTRLRPANPEVDQSGEVTGSVSFVMRPDDEQTAADMAARFATAWNVGERPFIAANFAPEPARAQLDPAGTPEARARIQEWVAERLGDGSRSRLSDRPGPITFYSGGMAKVQMPLKDGSGESALWLQRGERRWVVRLFAESGADGRARSYRIGGTLKEPTRVKNVPPVYPDEAKQAGVSGVVILECQIDPTGRVTDVTVLRSVPGLDQAAIDAVRQWEYTPTLLNGVAVPVIMTVTVNFRLH